MKLKLLFFAMVMASSVWAQNNATAPANPPGPALPTAPGLPASPANRGLPASPVNSGLPGFTNAFGALDLTSQFGTNLLPSELSPLLVNLQNDLAQLLPALAAFNDSFGFVNLGQSSTPSTASQSGANLGSNLSGNFSSAPAGVNAGQNLSTVTGGSSPSRTGLGALNGTNAALNTGLASGSANNGALPIGFSGTSGNSLRALIILQNDIQRLLPLVSALNGSPVETTPGVFTNTLAAATNRPYSPFPIQTTPLFPPQSGTLTPTGRR